MKTLIVSTLLVFVLVSCDEENTENGSWKFSVNGVSGKFDLSGETTYQVKNISVAGKPWLISEVKKTDTSPIGIIVIQNNDPDVNKSEAYAFMGCKLSGNKEQITTDSTIYIKGLISTSYRNIILTRD